MTEKTVEIIDGPSREEFLKAFAERKEIMLSLKNGTTVRFVMNKLEHEDGSGKSFIFVTTNNNSGYYHVGRKKGYLHL